MPNFIRALTSLGFEPNHLIIYDQNKPIGFLPAFKVNGDLKKIDSSPRNCYGGPILFKDTNTPIANTIQAINKKLASDILILNIFPCTKLGKQKFTPGPKTLILQRKPDESLEHIWQNIIEKKARTAVRFAEKQGVKTKHGHGELLDEFYSLYSTDLIRRGITEFPPKNYYKELLSDEDYSGIILGFDGDELIGAIFFAYGVNHAHLLSNCSTEKGKSLKVNNLLYWKFIEEAEKRKICYIDFGPSGDLSHIHFKETMGGKIVFLQRIKIINNVPKYFFVAGNNKIKSIIKKKFEKQPKSPTNLAPNTF
jgi:hypothetical protein